MPGIAARSLPALAPPVSFEIVDHACHQCGTTVEEGTAFCKQCGAPQIRVAYDEKPATPPLPPGTPEEMQPPAEPVTMAEETRAPAVPAGIDWSQAVPAAALGGLFLAAAAIPVVGVLLWVLGAGLVSVAFYRRRVPNAVLTPGLGARIGAVSGLFGFGIFAVIFALEMLASRGSGKLRRMLEEVIHQAAARNPDPRAQEAVQQMMTPAGLAFLITFMLVLFLVVFLLLSSAGGAVGAWLLGKKRSS